MPVSKDPALYKDVHPLMERAMASEHGIRVKMPSKQLATSTRLRCYAYRRALFEESKKLYQVDEVGFGWTPYDSIKISVELDNVGTWLSFRKREEFMSTLEIEELKDVKDNTGSDT